jgi:aminoglycoside phosphotransferase (APT) family kinase protein
VAKKYQLKALLSIVEAGANALDKASYHGDFAPWHILLLNDGRLGIIDAEHATSEGVEYYDIAYLIQRVYQVLDDSKLAKTIYQSLIDRGYHKGKLQTILVARAIGGFLDETLAQKNYQRAHQFAEWVVNL